MLGGSNEIHFHCFSLFPTLFFIYGKEKKTNHDQMRILLIQQ